MHLVKEHDNYALLLSLSFSTPSISVFFFQCVWDLSPHYYYSGAEAGDGAGVDVFK